MNSFKLFNLIELILHVWLLLFYVIA